MSFKQNNHQRFESLDWIRGLMAFSIMFYHYTSRYIKLTNSGSVTGRLGIYGVSAFYILSGLSLAIVYNKKITNFNSIKVFVIRRFFRIIPLLWFVTIIYLLVHRIPQYYLPIPSLNKLLLNLTGLFGFISPKSYFLTGAWSIGNELVFYSIFPLIIYMYDKNNVDIITQGPYK